MWIEFSYRDRGENEKICQNHHLVDSRLLRCGALSRCNGHHQDDGADSLWGSRIRSFAFTSSLLLEGTYCFLGDDGVISQKYLYRRTATSGATIGPKLGGVQEKLANPSWTQHFCWDPCCSLRKKKWWAQPRGWCDMKFHGNNWSCWSQNSQVYPPTIHPLANPCHHFQGSWKKKVVGSI